MSYLVKLLLSLSLSGSLLLLLLLALKPWYQKRLSQTWQYYIWLAVALRFILPLPPIIKLPAQNQLFPSTEPSPALPMPANNIAFNNNQSVTLPENLPELPEPTTAAAQILPLAGWLLLIWAAVALLLLCRQITIYQSFVQYVKSASQPIEDIALLNQLAACAEAMHINSQKPLELAFNPLLSSPVCLGLFKPVIILPSMAKTLPPEQLACIFQHELTHLRRHDLLYKWLVQLLICLHWFNPFVYLLSRQVNRTCELACDEAVIASLPPEDVARQTYGETLLAFCQQSAYKNSLAAITLTEGAAQLKERLGAIMKFKKKSKGIIAITAIFSVLVCVCFFVTGAYAASPATNNNLVLKDNGKPNEVSIKTESDRNIKETENKTEKTENQYSTEYAQHGITVTDGIYYYHGERVRIFMDLRMNGSFENFIFDNEGSIDLRVLRDKNNSITNVEYLTESEADELLYDMDEYSPDNQLEVPLEKEDSLDNSDVPLKDQNIGRSVRVTKEELSEELRDIISSCDTETWYVIKSAGYQYIYFGGLPYNYTFQPEIYTDRNSGTVNVFDMGTTTGNYVLLEIQQNVSLTINYNGTQISYTEL